MESICNSLDCSGCSACANICPVDAIKIEENDFYEMHPVIDNNKCINCQKCKKVCPQNNQPQFHEPKKVYVAWRKDKKSILDSASGGVAAYLSEYVIKNGGAVVGTEYDLNLRAVLTIKHTLTEIEKLKGSKYCYSNPQKIYKAVLSLLSQGKIVVFFGLPCQIAALENFLTINNMSKEQIIMVEILCHGVAPQGFFLDEINDIKHKNSISDITNVTFRSNRYLKNYALCFYQNEKIVKYINAAESPYFYGFSNNILLQESCFHCKFKSHKRIGDILIGDFLGLEMNFDNPYDAMCGKSLIISYTEKGQLLLSHILENGFDDICSFERTIDEAVRGGPSLRSVAKKHSCREEFRGLLKKEGYISARNQVVIPLLNNGRIKCILRKVKYLIKMFLSKFGIYEHNRHFFFNKDRLG